MKIKKMVRGTIMSSLLSARFSLSYSPSIRGDSTRQLHILGDLVDGFPDRGAQIAPANLKADGHIAGTVFPINVVGVIANLDFGQLSQ